MSTYKWTVTAIDYAPEQEEQENQGLVAALLHWEKMFRNGGVDDEHGEFIAGVLAQARKKL